MGLFRVMVYRIRSVWRRHQVKREIDDELRFHIDRRTADNFAAGMAPEEAAREARKRFGNLQSVREDCREARGASFCEGMWKDIHFALRQLHRSPGFTAIALLSLALGIGAGTAVFSLVNGILLRSLPVPNPHALRVLQWSGIEPRVGSHSGEAVRTGNRLTASSVSHPLFLNLREQAARQADIFGLCPLKEIVTRARGEAFTSNGMMVSDNFFSALGVTAVHGRLLNGREDYASGATSVVISHRWWAGRFALDPAVVGQAVTLNGASFTIVGVLPRGFGGVLSGDPSDFYAPMSDASPLLWTPITETRNWFVRLMARLRPGVGDAQFRAALDVAFAREAGGIMKEPRILVEPGERGLAYDRKSYCKPLLAMLGVVGLVMLVACANLAGLLLARGAARQHELAVRAALGASRWRLIHQSLIESLTLALAGGGLGVLLGAWGKHAISRLLAGSADGLQYDFSLDFTVLGFSLAAVLVTALLSGIFPALRAGRADPLGGLKSRCALGISRLRVGRVFVAAQICVSLLLLTGAGLYVRTLVNLTRIDAGFSMEKLLLFQLKPGGTGYEGARLTAFYDRVQDSLATLPGVKGATLLHNTLIADKYDYGRFTFPGRPASSFENLVYRLIVSETFWTTLDMPLVHGRGLRATDTEGASKVVVVNEAFVREYLRDEDPLGRTVEFWDADWQIVGVCRDAKYRSIKDPVPPTVYLSFRQYSRSDTYFAVRTVLPPLALTTAARRTVAAIDPNVPVSGITTQAMVRDKAISPERTLATLGGALAGLALLLSCIGLYGLMAYNVARRTGEIGIRMALGATRWNIAWPILREAASLAVVGAGVGLPLALGLTRFVRSQLFGVEPNDPWSLASAAVLLIVVALLSAGIPAGRAARISPREALRSE